MEGFTSGKANRTKEEVNFSSERRAKAKNRLFHFQTHFINIRLQILVHIPDEARVLPKVEVQGLVAEAPAAKVETEESAVTEEAVAPEQKPPEEEDEDGMKKMRKDFFANMSR